MYMEVGGVYYFGYGNTISQEELRLLQREFAELSSGYSSYSLLSVISDMQTFDWFERLSQIVDQGKHMKSFSDCRTQLMGEIVASYAGIGKVIQYPKESLLLANVDFVALYTEDETFDILLKDETKIHGTISNGVITPK